MSLLIFEKYTFECSALTSRGKPDAFHELVVYGVTTSTKLRDVTVSELFSILL